MESDFPYVKITFFQNAMSRSLVDRYQTLRNYIQEDCDRNITVTVMRQPKKRKSTYDYRITERNCRHSHTRAGHVKFPLLPLSVVAHDRAYLSVAISCPKLDDALFYQVPFFCFFSTDNCK
jgi:hypothetical protein